MLMPLSCLLLPVLSAVTLLAGCSNLVISSGNLEAPVSVAGVQEVPSAVSTQTAQAKELAPPKLTSFSETQQITRSATMTLKVTDTNLATTRIGSIAHNRGGTVATVNGVSAGEVLPAAQTTIVINIPAEQLEASLTDIAASGEVTLSTLGSAEVTARAADLDTSIKRMRESINQLNEHLAQVSAESEIAQVTAGLKARESDLESLQNQKRALSASVTQSTITVTLTS